MTKRPTAWCDHCESTVYTDDVHSCFDAKAERAQRERERALTVAERAVVEAAEAFAADPWRGDLEGTVIGVSMEYDANGQYVLYEDVLPIIEAVRALRAVRGVG